MPHATLPSPGLQVLILCGPGESLSTFTSNPKESPKALVPIANRPMVWYPLDWCYRMGITDITLITPAESRSALETALKTNPDLTGLPNPKPEVIAPEDLTQTTGTAELLRIPEIQQAITSDFIVLPCDLISELEGTKLIQQWMSLNPLSTSVREPQRKGGLGLFYPTHGLEGISEKKEYTDFIATAAAANAPVQPPQGSLRSQIETLVTTMPTDTLNDKIEDGQGVLKLRTQLTNKYGHVRLKTKHRDAHIYIFPKWVKEFAARNEKFSSISEDLLGWWAKAQWQTGLGEKLGLDVVLSPKLGAENDMADSGRMDDEEEDETFDAAQLSSTKYPSTAQRPTTTFASRLGQNAPSLTKETLEVPPLLAYIQPNHTSPTPTGSQLLIRRVDTSKALLSVSLYLAKQPTTHPLSHEHKVHPTATMGLQSRVSQEDSLISQNVAIGIRTIIKESVVGANCDIGNNVRLTRCLLMDGVTVGDGVQMTGCIVGRRARIEGMKPVPPPTDGSSAVEGDGRKKGKQRPVEDDEDRTRLTDCEVAPNFVVEAGTDEKGVIKVAFDTEGFDEEEEDDEMETESEA